MPINSKVQKKPINSRRGKYNHEEEDDEQSSVSSEESHSHTDSDCNEDESEEDGSDSEEQFFSNSRSHDDNDSENDSKSSDQESDDWFKNKVRFQLIFGSHIFDNLFPDSNFADFSEKKLQEIEERRTAQENEVKGSGWPTQCYSEVL